MAAEDWVCVLSEENILVPMKASKVIIDVDTGDCAIVDGLSTIQGKLHRLLLLKIKDQFFSFSVEVPKRRCRKFLKEGK